ncbi:ATP-binding protein [Octadecabacter arcticus]|nr:ATP-binding protein [Octadecabacter arcticus]
MDRFFALIAVLFAIAAISLLTVNVSREIQWLGSARHDNLEWFLVQLEVEFLEFSQQTLQDPIDIIQLREEFDIFFSRVMTIRDGSFFEDLRMDKISNEQINALISFVDQSATFVDAPDYELLRNMPELVSNITDVRPIVGILSNSAVDFFAQAADGHRLAVGRTMIQLAIAIAVLIIVLALAILYLIRLNRGMYLSEREKSQAMTRMKMVIGTSLDGVVVCDLDGKILELSRAAEAIFGYSEAAVLGRNFGSVIVPNHLCAAQDAGMARMKMGGDKKVIGKGRVQLEAQHKDGHIFPVEIAIQSATTDEGEIFIAFLRDISRRVKAEAALVTARDKALASEKMKTEFLTTMSHEIRTPLNGLLGSMALLRDTALTENQDRYISYMETSGRLLLSHVSNVLDITSYDVGKLNTNIEPMNISELMQDIVDSQSGTAFTNKTSLVWGWNGPKMDWIFSDHERLQHVMMNLVGNAVKFTRCGKVSVMIESFGKSDGARLRISIADTGQGMTEDLAKRVFDDFVTGNTAYDREVGGTGLGLSIAKRFVNALGGEIGVRSIVDEGSTFWFELPVREAESPKFAPAQINNLRPSRSLKVLLVEDNEINRTVAHEMLLADGHTVVEANDGFEGVEMSKTEEFDIILMDISMPVMDGRAATRMIRADGGASANTAIFALTANAMIEEQEEFLKDGMDGILTKPLSRKALRGVLNKTRRPADDDNAILINHSHSAETREALGEETFVKLRSRFISEVDELLAWLGTDETHDFLEVASRSHKVAGSAAVFGADRLQETLKAIETSAKRGESQGIQERTKAAGSVWQRTQSELISKM